MAAVDQNPQVRDILVQSWRHAKAAKQFMAKLMKKQCRGGQGAGHRQVPLLRPDQREPMRSAEHRSRKGLNNRAKSSPWLFSGIG
ncbi:transposase-like protein [Streptomyces sp. V4I8]